MDLHTIIENWTAFASITGFVSACGALFYRVKTGESRMDKMEERFKENIDTLMTHDNADHRLMMTKVEQVETGLNKLELNLAQSYVTKEDLDRRLSRMEDKLDLVVSEALKRMNTA